MSEYKAEPIRAHARQCSSTAESMTGLLAILGFLLGGSVGLFFDEQRDATTLLISITSAFVCTLPAAWLGSRWASDLRSKAEQAKCMLAIEENTAQLLQILSEREDLQFVVKLEAAAMQRRKGQTTAQSKVITALGSSE